MIKKAKYVKYFIVSIVGEHGLGSVSVLQSTSLFLILLLKLQLHPRHLKIKPRKVVLNLNHKKNDHGIKPRYGWIVRFSKLKV